MSDVTPPPRRRLWPFLLIGLVLAAGLFTAHAIWDGHERSIVEREIARIRAAGEPIDPAGLAEANVADADNAALVITSAAAQIVEPKERRERLSQLYADDPFAFSLPLTPAERELLQATIEDNAAVLADVTRLETCRGAAWHVQPPPGAPRMFRLLPGLGASREVMNLLADAARLEVTFDAAVFFRRLDLIDRIARAVAAHRDDVSSLTSRGGDALVAAMVIDAAPYLALNDVAARAAAERRIGQLMDDREHDRVHRDGLLAHRVERHEVMQLMRQGLLNGPQLSLNMAPSLTVRFAAWVESPIVSMNDASLLEYNSTAIALADAATWKEYDNRAGPLRAIESHIKRGKMTIVAQVIMYSAEVDAKSRFRTLTERRLAAVALAARLYATDHNNTLPHTLAELVPTYLSAVPLDAMDGQPIRYDVTRAIIWGVGADLIDNHGDGTPLGPKSGNTTWLHRDAVVHLKPTTRPLPP